MSLYIDLCKYHQHEEKHAYYLEMTARMLSAFEKQCGKAENFRILELGAGTGLFTKHLLNLSSVDVTAIERDEACYLSLKQIFDHTPPVRLLLEDSRTFYDPNGFDCIFSSFSDHHILLKDKRKYLENVRKNLRPQGLFIVGDEFLPEHKANNRQERIAALHAYHQHIIDIAVQREEWILAELEGAALRSGLEERVDAGDYKLSCKQYERWLMEAGFRFCKEKIGPLDREDVGGVYVYQAWKTGRNVQNSGVL